MPYSESHTGLPLPLKGAQRANDVGRVGHALIGVLIGQDVLPDGFDPGLLMLPMAVAGHVCRRIT